jgi:hypothetical protein
MGYSDITNKFSYSWSSYLNEEDYLFLLQFIYNLQNNLPNDKICILVGRPRTGKTSLIKEIKTIIDEDNFLDNKFLEGQFFFEPKKLAIHICGINSYTENIYVNAIKNFLTNNMSIISDTNTIENLHPSILENAYIINMTHDFSS